MGYVFASAALSHGTGQGGIRLQQTGSLLLSGSGWAPYTWDSASRFFWLGSSLEFESVRCVTMGSASWVFMLSASIDRQQVSGSAKMLIFIVG